MFSAACQVQQSSASALVLDESTAPATQRHDARTLVLLEAAIAHTLATLAAPNILVNIAQSSNQKGP